MKNKMLKNEFLVGDITERIFCMVYGGEKSIIVLFI